jgi:hypothetical protein
LSEEKSEEIERKKAEKKARIISLALAIVLFAAGGFIFYYGFVIDPSFNFIGLILGIFMISFAFNLLNVGARGVPPLVKPVNTVSVIKCHKCEYTEIRDFQKGDYIFKELDECKDCNNVKYIKTIYTIVPEEEKK